jgi:hypothetical protein
MIAILYDNPLLQRTHAVASDTTAWWTESVPGASFYPIFPAGSTTGGMHLMPCTTRTYLYTETAIKSGLRFGRDGDMIEPSSNPIRPTIEPVGRKNISHEQSSFRI